MTKFLLFLSLFSLSTFFPDIQAGSQPLKCKFHDSRNCRQPDLFEKELKMGCASPAGNCRYQFCKTNCVMKSDDHHVLRLCKKNCFSPSLLVRFNSDTREALYSNFMSAEGRAPKEARKYAKMAYAKESAVQEAKNKQWWRFGRPVQNTALYERLEAEYLRLIEEKIKRMKVARQRGETGTVDKLKEEIAHDIAAASTTLVPSQQPPAIAQAQEDTRDKRLTIRQRELAAKVIQKWWRSTKGQLEAKRIEKQRAEVARTLVAEAEAPQEVLSQTKRISGEWREGPEGRYFVPKAPPPPQSEKIKRLSMELRRQSAAIANLPPPPPELLVAAPTPEETGTRLSSVNVVPPAEEVGIIPPAPPPPPAGWAPQRQSAVPPPPTMPQGLASAPAMPKGPALMGALQDQIKAGKKLRPPSSESSENLAKQKRRSSSASPSSSPDLNQDLRKRLAKIAKANEDEEEEENSAPLTPPSRKIARSPSSRSSVKNNSSVNVPSSPSFGAAPAPQGNRGELLAQIQQGRKLKAVNKTPTSSTPAKPAGIFGALSQAIAQKQGEQPEEVNNDSTWDD